MRCEGDTMNAFEWKDMFNIGHKELDSDHRKYFDLLNECYMSSCAPGSAKANTDLLRRDKSYAAMHFSYEEEVLRASGYPDYERHEKLHRSFEEHLAELENVNEITGEHKYESMFSFLLEWFQKHILEEDRKCIPYLKKSVEA